jgi:hypothetical protein
VRVALSTSGVFPSIQESHWWAQLEQARLKHSRLERVAFQLYTLQGKGCPSGTCRIPNLHPAGGKLPCREYVASSLILTSWNTSRTLNPTLLAAFGRYVYSVIRRGAISK